MENPTTSQKKSTIPPPRAAQSLKYEALDTKNHEIRLLRIKPSLNPDQTIRCELFRTALDKAPPYNALSYSWGDRAGSSPIRINLGSVDITPNLKDALQRLRPKDEDDELILWVDAICINQNDIAERNVQTRKMRLIYRKAEKVLVWVGISNSACKAAMELVRDLNSAKNPGSIIRDPGRRGDVESLVTLFRRQYWWRIWVVQEVSSAKATTVYCGDDAISWDMLEVAVDIMKQEEDQLRKIFYKHPSKIRTLTHGGPRGLQVSRYSPGTRAPPLLEVLLSHKSKQSSDPRDKVYALIGISSSRETFGNIDYSLTMRETYSETARHIISTTQMLDVICVKQRDDNQFNLPTWVPDWLRQPRDYGHPRIGLHHHEPPFSAAGSSLASVSFTKDGYVLRVKGLRIDHIKTLGMPFKKYGPPPEISSDLQAFKDYSRIFFGFRDQSIDSQVEFGKIISCGNWSFDNKDTYREKLQAISDIPGWYLIDEANRVPASRSREEVRQGEIPGGEIESSSEGRRAQIDAILSASLTMNRRRLFISSDNKAGLAPWDAEVGDIICVLLGCRFPVVLRPKGKHYKLIGEAYVYGFMDGGAMTGLDDGHFQRETFEIH